MSPNESTAAAAPEETDRTVIGRAPGRVNLIGDHTDYNDGLAMPMAIQLGAEVYFTENGTDRLLIYTSIDATPADLPLDLAFDHRAIDDVEPHWARLPAAVAAQCRPDSGGVARLTSDLPVGAGLASSAATCVALAVSFGVDPEPRIVARMCQRAEELVGASIGLMDPMVSVAGRAGHALVIDFADLSIEPVAVPDDVEVVVVHSGVDRQLARSPYAARRAECEAAAIELGIPLGRAELADVPGIHDPILRRRARHVAGECERVRAFTEAFRSSDVATAGKLMSESHRSMSEDFEASLPVVDRLVADLSARPGVYGARMTGGGFGGCVVTLAVPGALDPASFRTPAWRVRAVDGASRRSGPAV